MISKLRARRADMRVWTAVEEDGVTVSAIRVSLEDIDALLAELEAARAHECRLPDSIIQALNSGDGSYRP